MANAQGFINEVLPDARAAAKALDIPVAPVLAQWINETGSGTSDAWVKGHNPAGISIMEPQMERLGAKIPKGWGTILSFPSIQHGLLAYILRWRDPVYGPTRAEWASNRDSHAVATAIQNSPWAAGHYEHHGLNDLIAEYRLDQYDTPGAVPVPAPGPNGPPVSPPQEPPCGALPPGPPPHGAPLLRVGVRGPEVAQYQAELAGRGFPSTNSLKQDGHWDGIFGPATAEATVRFQEANGLHPDGIVGRQVYCALGQR